MTATSGLGELFGYRKPKIGRAKGGITVERSGAVTVEHALVKLPATSRVDDVAYVVRVDDEERQPLFLAGDPRFLSLDPKPNVALVFHRPLRFPRFKFGADKALPISGRERRRGLDCDVLLLAVDDDEAFVRRLTSAEVPVSPTLNEALLSTFGLAVGDELERQRRVLRRTKRMVAAWMAFGTLLSIGMIMGFVLGPRQASTATWIRGTAASIATFLLATGVMALLYGSGSSRKPKLLAVLCLVSSLVSAGAVRVFGGSPLLVGPLMILLSASGAWISGLVVGAIVAILPRRSDTGDDAATFSASEPAPEKTTRRPGSVLAIVVGLVVLAVASLTQPGSISDMRIARSAIKSIDDGIPADWVRIPASPFVADHEGHPCVDGTMSHTAASRRVYGKPTVSPEIPLNNGEAEVLVLMAPDLEAARAEVAHLSNPAYEACAGELAKDAVAGSRTISTGGIFTAVHQRRTEIGADGIDTGIGAIDTFQVRISDANGNLTGTAAVARVQIGRTIVEVLAHNTSDMTLDPTELETFVNAVIDNARAELT